MPPAAARVGSNLRQVCKLLASSHARVTGWVIRKHADPEGEPHE